MKISIEDKKAEAIRRMKKMGVFSETIKQFEKDGYISRSEPPFGAFYWVEGEELARIHEFEKERNALVYMVIDSYFRDIGHMISYLYVEDEMDEWTFFDSDAENGILFTYTINVDDPDESEFGSIGYKMGIGAGPVRIS